jgi:hypothetical protein
MILHFLKSNYTLDQVAPDLPLGELAAENVVHAQSSEELNVVLVEDHHLSEGV